MILDIGSDQTPVVYWTDAVDVTTDIIALYDKSNALPAGAAATPPAKPPAAPAAAKPPAVSPAKK
jgi:hypothetical protein